MTEHELFLIRRSRSGRKNHGQKMKIKEMEYKMKEKIVQAMKEAKSICLSFNDFKSLEIISRGFRILLKNPNKWETVIPSMSNMLKNTEEEERRELKFVLANLSHKF